MAGQQRAIVTGPAAWIGPHLQQQDTWIYRLTEPALREIDAALAHACGGLFQGTG